jgi:hypothetical protein
MLVTHVCKYIRVCPILLHNPFFAEPFFWNHSFHWPLCNQRWQKCRCLRKSFFHRKQKRTAPEEMAFKWASKLLSGKFCRLESRLDCSTGNLSQDSTGLTKIHRNLYSSTFHTIRLSWQKSIEIFAAQPFTRFHRNLCSSTFHKIRLGWQKSIEISIAQPFTRIDLVDKNP